MCRTCANDTYRHHAILSICFMHSPGAESDLFVSVTSWQTDVNQKDGGARSWIEVKFADTRVLTAFDYVHPNDGGKNKLIELTFPTSLLDPTSVADPQQFELSNDATVKHFFMLDRQVRLVEKLGASPHGGLSLAG